MSRQAATVQSLKRILFLIVIITISIHVWWDLSYLLIPHVLPTTDDTLSDNAPKSTNCVFCNVTYLTIHLQEKSTSNITSNEAPSTSRISSGSSPTTDALSDIIPYRPPKSLNFIFKSHFSDYTS